MLDSAWPAMVAIWGYSDGSPRGSKPEAGSCMRPDPITMMRLAPMWMAGEIGAVCRMDPSPKNCKPPSNGKLTAGNTNGMAEEAMRCSAEMRARTARRCERVQG